MGDRNAKQSQPAKEPQTLNVNLHLSPAVMAYFEAWFRRLENYARASARREIAMSQEMDDLEAQVSETATVEQSAIVLLQGLKAALAAAGTDPAKLKALRDGLDSSEQALATAIIENTPAATE